MVEITRFNAIFAAVFKVLVILQMKSLKTVSIQAKYPNLTILCLFKRFSNDY